MSELSRQEISKESPEFAEEESFQQIVLLLNQKKFSEAIPLLKFYAEKDHPKAQYNLGKCYEQGDGVDKDLKAAARYYQDAAKKGLASAQHKLGVCYFEGRGINKDIKAAFKHYQDAANQGFADAQCNIGLMLLAGYGMHGIDRDVKKAAGYFQSAATQDYAKAQYYLGICYFEGRGVSKDVEKAFTNFQAAVNGGYAKAHHDLGVCYENGHGVTKDAKKAMSCYFEAADGRKNLLGLIKRNPELEHEAICMALSYLGKKQDPELLKVFRGLTGKDYLPIGERQNKLAKLLDQLGLFPTVVSSEIIDYEKPAPEELISKENTSKQCHGK